MSRFTTTLLACAVAAAFAGRTAEGAALTKAENVALKQAIVACKAEAKGKKIAWLSRRKYVNHCVAGAVKEHPNIDVIRMLKDHPEMRELPMDNWDSI